LGEDQGHRQLLAEQFGRANIALGMSPEGVINLPITSSARVHDLAEEFQLSPDEILDLIAETPRLKMAVRGWVAQRHLLHQLQSVPDVVECEEILGDRQPDVRIRLRGGKPVLVECKNVLRRTDSSGHPKLDFMRTRVSIANPCSRYYSPSDFQVVAACLHAQLEQWVFRYRLTREMYPHPKCPGKLEHRVVVDEYWSQDTLIVLKAAAA
jgi:hypothetical protein